MLKLAGVESNWSGPTPEEVEDQYDGTPLLARDRARLYDAVQKVKGEQGGFKRFLVNNPKLSFLIPGLLSAVGAAVLGRNQPKMTALGVGGFGLLGGLAGAGVSGAARNSENEKVIKQYVSDNKGFLNKYYTNPDRFDYRLKRARVNAAEGANSARNTRNLIETLRYFDD